MPNPDLMGLGILYAMGWPEMVNLPGHGLVFKVDDKLTNEYLRKFLQCPGYHTPHLTEDFQWRAAEPLLRKGYRDHELAFGDTWSEGRMARGRGGFYFIKIVKECDARTRERRLWFRRYWPYKRIQRAWPWCLEHDGGEVRWWHALNYRRWMRRPRFTWGNAEVVEMKPRGIFAPAKSPIDPEAEAALTKRGRP